MRVLVVTRIFPSSVSPKAAPYIRQQCTALSRLCELEVMGTLPWFPGQRFLSRFARHSLSSPRVPYTECIADVTVHHPRVLRIPRLATLNSVAYAASLAPWVARRRPRPDAMLAVWAYPDGVAAVALGRMLGVPTFVEAIGSDVNVTARAWGPRVQLRASLPHAAGVIAVSQPLGEAMVELGAPRERVHAIPTGVDRSLFRPQDRASARAQHGLPPEARVILFVGRLCEAKGLAELFDAFRALARQDARYHLVIVGDGPWRSRCEQWARPLGNRITLTGEVSVDAVPQWLAACDVLTLPSYSEGTPNVVLEALAAGRKVVATRVGGIPDFVTQAEQGELILPRQADALHAALTRVCSTAYDPAEVERLSQVPDWDENARRVLAVLRGS